MLWPIKAERYRDKKWLCKICFWSGCTLKTVYVKLKRSLGFVHVSQYNCVFSWLWGCYRWRRLWSRPSIPREVVYECGDTPCCQVLLDEPLGTIPVEIFCCIPNTWKVHCCIPFLSCYINLLQALFQSRQLNARQVVGPIPVLSYNQGQQVLSFSPGFFIVNGK